MKRITLDKTDLASSILDQMCYIEDLDKFIKFVSKQDDVLYSEKIDGVRCTALCTPDNIIYYSKNFIQFPNFSKFDEDVRKLYEKMYLRVNTPNIYLDGEVHTTNGVLADIMGQVYRKKDIDVSDVEFSIFDIVDKKMIEERITFSTRLNWLEHIFKDVKTTCVHKMEYKSISPNKEDIWTQAEQSYSKGFEGIVLRNRYGWYEPGKKSNYVCKAKKHHTLDLKVVDVEQGIGRCKGILGALHVIYNDVVIRVGTGFSDEERKEFIVHPPNIVEIKYKTITDNGLLREPVFIRVRYDKTDDQVSKCDRDVSE